MAAKYSDSAVFLISYVDRSCHRLVTTVPYCELQQAVTGGPKKGLFSEVCNYCTLKDVPYIKTFSSLCGVRLVTKKLQTFKNSPSFLPTLYTNRHATMNNELSFFRSDL